MRAKFYAFLLFFPLWVSGPAWGVEAYEAYRERTSMLLIAQHCGTLSPLEHAALVSGQVQARGTLLRAGEDLQSLDDLYTDLAKRAANVACDNEDVHNEIVRMQEAAELWSRMFTMVFPARWQNWEARREDALEKARWRVRSPLNGPDGVMMDFGLVAHGEEVFLDLLVLGGRTPSSVLLHMRDPKLLAAPLNDDLLRLLGRTKDGRTIDGPASFMPPQSVVQSFFAADKIPVPPSLFSDAGFSQSGPGKAKSDADAQSILFRFGAKALSAFSAMDPRDVVAIELVYPARYSGKNGPVRERVYVEVGDFVAARLFAETFPEEDITAPELAQVPDLKAELAAEFSIN